MTHTHVMVSYNVIMDLKLHPFIELDYVFGQFTGILVTSTIWFILYCVWKRNKPKIYPEVILPALASGIMWGIAMGKDTSHDPLILSHDSFDLIT